MRFSIIVNMDRFDPAADMRQIPRLLDLLGGRPVEAYGKAALIGLGGEVEHGCALIHTLRFGNHLREAVSGKAFIPSTNKLAAANASITMPLKHKDRDGARSHFLSLEFSISDAPKVDEIVVVLCVADGAWPHHRIGDRYQDMTDLNVDQTPSLGGPIFRLFGRVLLRIMPRDERWAARCERGAAGLVIAALALLPRTRRRSELHHSDRRTCTSSDLDVLAI